MADDAGVGVYLPVVAALKGLVSEEVDVLIGDAVGLLGFVLDVSEAVGLVPAVGEDIEGDLTADGVTARQAVSCQPQGKGRSMESAKAV